MRPSATSRSLPSGPEYFFLLYLVCEYLAYFLKNRCRRITGIQCTFGSPLTQLAHLRHIVDSLNGASASRPYSFTVLANFRTYSCDGSSARAENAYVSSKIFQQNSL